MSHVTTTQIAAVALLNSLLAAPASAATTYDLTTQWVNGTNPNGPWSLVQGSTPLPYVKVWTSWPTTPKLTRQSAFAPGPITNTHPGDYIPAWFKSTANYSFGTGEWCVERRGERSICRAVGRRRHNLRCCLFPCVSRAPAGLAGNCEWHCGSVRHRSK